MTSTGVETVGHEWDGIEELNNPLPRWWLWSFYACIIFSIGYVIVYPAIPLLNKGNRRACHRQWSSRGATGRPRPRLKRRTACLADGGAGCNAHG